MWDFNHQLHKSMQPGVVTEFINHSDWAEDHRKNETLHSDGNYSTIPAPGAVWLWRPRHDHHLSAEHSHSNPLRFSSLAQNPNNGR